MKKWNDYQSNAYFNSQKRQFDVFNNVDKC